MKQRLKRILAMTPLYYPLRNWRVGKRQRADLAAWERRGRVDPPPHLIKQRTLLEHAERFGLKILVETGTYYGDMVEAMRHRFDRIWSIEVSSELYEAARARFRGAKHIELIHGDSGQELQRVLAKVDQPALFWLDGHYSAGDTSKGVKETPILEEIEHILSAPDRGHVIIIDDARLFGADPAYPSIEELRRLIVARRPGSDVHVQDDSIRVTPRR